MKLTFLGNGAAFASDFDNTAAYFIENQELFLIDCGETVFKTLLHSSFFQNIKKIHLFITHLHSDHVGSVGSLALYSNSVLGEKLHIYTSRDCKYLSSLRKLLRATGSFAACKFHFVEELDGHYQTFSSITFQETEHVPALDCYSIIFHTSNGKVFYSGDTKKIDLLLSIIQSDDFDLAYMDATSSTLPNHPHVSIYDLDKAIPKNLREKIYCMHFNNSSCIKLAKDMGFSVVEVI